jgi:hypothetical protein
MDGVPDEGGKFAAATASSMKFVGGDFIPPGLHSLLVGCVIFLIQTEVHVNGTSFRPNIKKKSLNQTISGAMEHNNLLQTTKGVTTIVNPLH